MEYVVICIAAVLVSGLTLFSGFGLGSLLMPVFALFFPVPEAIAMTAVVHLLNNLFKLVLLGKHADGRAVLLFGLPAVVMAFIGARILVWIADIEPVLQYNLGERECDITIVKLVIAITIFIFAVSELGSRFGRLSLSRKYLPLGGILSGFFGGLSGHQGALRSAFLIKSGLEKECFIATGVVISCMVDVIRLIVYTERFREAYADENISLLIAGCLAAFLGAFIGRRLVKKVTMRAVRLVVMVMLLLIALALGSGII